MASFESNFLVQDNELVDSLRPSLLHRIHIGAEFIGGDSNFDSQFFFQMLELQSWIDPALDSLKNGSSAPKDQRRILCQQSLQQIDFTLEKIRPEHSVLLHAIHEEKHWLFSQKNDSGSIVPWFVRFLEKLQKSDFHLSSLWRVLQSAHRTLYAWKKSQYTELVQIFENISDSSFRGKYFQTHLQKLLWEFARADGNLEKKRKYSQGWTSSYFQ